MKRDDVIAYLNHCDLSELSGILNAVLPVRSKELLEDFTEIKLLLVEAALLHNESKWSYRIVTKPNLENNKYTGWEFDNGEPYVQQGNCESCKAQLCSHAKEVKCPLCDDIVYLT